MKKRFSDEQIISILREAEAGVLAVTNAARCALSMPRFTPCVKRSGGMEVPELAPEA
jgi:putative transposase